AGAHLGGALEQTRVEVEHVPGIRLATRRTAEEERQLPVGRRLLGEIVVDDERVAAAVAEVLAHAAPGVWREELHGGRIGRRGDDNGRVVHRAVARELVDHLRHGRALLADGDVEAHHVAAALVDDGVEGDGGLARLPVADDQLALPAPDRDHAVDGLDARLEGLLHRLPRDDAGRLELDAPGGRRLERALAVHGLPEGVHHAAEQRLTDRDLGDAAGAADLVTLFDLLLLAEDGDADVVLLEVQDDAVDAVGKLDELARRRLVEAVDPGDAVAAGEDHARLPHLELLLVSLDLLADDVADLGRADLHWSLP